MRASRTGRADSMIALPTGTHIWIAAGMTDLRRGFTGLSAVVQTVLEQNPFSGHVFVFRGRRGDLIKVLWWDGDGLCLFAKRLERGRFSGTVSRRYWKMPTSRLAMSCRMCLGLRVKRCWKRCWKTRGLLQKSPNWDTGAWRQRFRRSWKPWKVIG